MERTDTLGRAQILSAVLLGSSLAAAALALVVPDASGPRLPDLALPAGVLGLLQPVLGYRLYLARRVAAGRLESREGRETAFLSATVTVLALGEAAALFGCAAFWLSEQPLALAGVATHILIGGTVWPSAERMQLFVEAGPS